MKKILLAAVFLSGISIVSKAGVGAEQKSETGSIQGTIFDAETKKPIANLTFTATFRKTSFQKDIVTDANGNFKINNVPVGEHTVTIDKVGYRAVKKEGVIIKEGAVFRIDFEVTVAEEEIHQPFIAPITIHSFE